MSKFFLLLFIISVTLQSCISGNAGTEEIHEKTIKLIIPDKEFYDSTIIVTLIKVEDLEVQIPLSHISKYLELGKGNTYESYSADSKFINSFSTKENLKRFQTFLSIYQKGISDSSFDIGRGDFDRMYFDDFKRKIQKFYINDRKFFESGDFYVYNTKTKSFYEEIIISEESWYRDPLAASYKYIVKAKGTVLYYYLITA